jgi:FKBP-type peptidyl-prolyl cis-trans isomerase
LRSPRQFWQSSLGSLKKLFALPHARELERELSAVNGVNQSLQLEFQGVQSELQVIKERDEKRLADLQQRVIAIEADRDAARQQVKTLELNLAEASTRLDSAETRVNVLDQQMEDEGREHQVEMQQVRERASKQERRLKWVMLLATFAFILAGLAGVTEIRDVRKNALLLADMSQDIKDIKGSVMQQIGSVHTLPGGGPPAEPADESRVGRVIEKVPAMATDDEEVKADPPEKPQGARAPGMPAPAQVSSNERPARISNRPTKEEMQTFFEENSRRPNVISLPSGLQYKVLRQGHGRTPATTDTVVIDYRGFLPDGTEFDSSYREVAPAAFVVNELNPGLKEALLKMKEGTQWELYIPPSLTQKGGTRKRGITGYEPHFYVVELISVIQAGGEEKP